MSTTLYVLSEQDGAYLFTPQSTPPPPSGTKAVYYQGATDAQMLAALPAISAASYNTPLVAAQWTDCLAWIKENGLKAWVTLGVWSDSSGGWDLTQAQQQALVQQTVTELGAANVVFYLADEPGSSFGKTITARAAALRAAVPGTRYMIAYWDYSTVGNYKGLDLIAGSIYPNKFNFNYSLIPQFANACKAASLPFTGIAAVASDTPVVPTPAQFTTIVNDWKAAGSDGWGGYSWGLGLQGSAYVSAAKAL